MPERRVNQYKLMEELGRGGTGVVYRALDTNLGRTVALKLLIAGRFASKEERERFLRQARYAAQIDHPLVVKQYDAAVADNVPYIATELIDGTKLEGSAERFGWTWRQVAYVIASIADAIAAAHRAGIIHRDLKPANIIVDGDDRPHVTDFGLAKATNVQLSMSHTGQILGTPAYMSSEQALGEPRLVDFRTDIYSIGAILYELLTGVPPFQGTYDQVLFQVLHDEPSPPSKLNPRVPKDLETICLRAMSKSPDRRFQSAEDFRDELLRFTRGEPILSRPISRLERIFRFCRRYPTQTASATGIILLLAISTIVVTLWALDSRENFVKELRLRQVTQELLRERTEELIRLNLDRANESTELGQQGRSLAWINNAEKIDDQNILPAENYDRRWAFTSAAASSLTAAVPIESLRRLIAYNSEKGQVITYSDGQISIHDAFSGQLYRNIKMPKTVFGAVTNHTNTLLAIIVKDVQTEQLSLQVWNVDTLRSMIELAIDPAISAVTFAPGSDDILIKNTRNEGYLVSTHDGTIQPIFEGKAVHFLQSDENNAVIVTVEGNRRLSIYSRDIKSPSTTRDFENSILHIWTEPVDGFIMIRLTDTIKMQFCCWQYEHPDSDPLIWNDIDIQSSDIDPAHERILLRHSHSIDIYRIRDQKLLHHLDVHSSRIHTAFWSSDYAVCYTTGPNQSHSTLNRWELERNHVTENYLTLASGIKRIVTSRDRYSLLTCGNDSILRIWNPPLQDSSLAPFALVAQDGFQGVTPESPPFDQNQPEFAAIQSLLATNSDPRTIANQNLRVRGSNVLQDSKMKFLARTTEDGRFQVLRQSDSKLIVDQPMVDNVPDGIFLDEKESMFLTSISKTEIAVAPIDPVGPIIRLSKPTSARIQDVAFHPDSSLIAACMLDRSIVIWRVTDRNKPCISFSYRSPISILQWTPSDDRLLVIGQDGKVAVYKIQDDSVTNINQFNVDKLIASSAIDPTGTMLAATTNQSEVQVWDLSRGEPCSSRLRFQSPISKLRFAPNGSSLLMKDSFGLVHYYPIRQATLPRDSRDAYIALSLGETIQPDGRWEDISNEALKEYASKWNEGLGRKKSLNSASRINWHKRQAVDAILSDYPELAVYHYKEATRLDPKNRVLMKDLAHASALAHQWENSLNSWERVIELGDRSFSNYYNTSLIAAKLNNSMSLKRILKQLETEFLHSDDPEVLLKLSQIYVSVPPPLGDLDRSIELARKVIKVRPNDVRPLMVLGGSLYLRGNKGDKEEAGTILDAILRKMPPAIVGIVKADLSLVPLFVRQQARSLRESANQKPQNIQRAYTRWTSFVEAELIEARSPDFRGK